jgi:hypothetical protein
MVAEDVLISNCKLPIVLDPATDLKNCSCPDPRVTLTDPTHFSLLSPEQMIQIQYGQIPMGMKKGGAILTGHDGKKTSVELILADRCEPFRCLYIDTEGTIDEAWAVANGVDPSLLLLVGGNWAEQVLDLAEDFILTKEVDLVVLDSLDMLTPGDTLAKALEDTPQIASKAGIMTRAMQKWTTAINEGGLLNRYTPTIVIVCQVRAQHIGKPWASLGPSGGWAVGHGISLDIRLAPEKYEYKGDYALFGNFEYMIRKSKAGGFPRSEGKFRFWLRPGKGRQVGDTEDLETVVDHGKKHGFIEHTSKWTLLSKFLSGAKKAFGTKTKLKQFLRDNPSVYIDLRTRVLSHLIGEDISIELPSTKLEKEEKKKAKKKGMKKVKKKKKPLEDIFEFVD